MNQYRERSGMHMSGGERKMLSIARAVAMDPQLLLLDEPFEGLSPAVIPTISEGIASIRKLGRAVLMARSEEHTSELQSLMRNSYAVFCLKKQHNQMTNKRQIN